MEENEVVMEGNNEKNGNTKKIIIAVVAIVVVILAIVGIVNAVKPSPEKAVKSFLKNLDSKKIEKAIDQMDFVGMAAFDECEDDYEDFKDNYNDFKDEYEDDKEETEEYIDEMVEELQDTIDDLDEFNVEIKEVKKARKVKDAKNLYKVRAKIKTIVKSDDDTERDNSTIDFYVYKVSGKYKIVGMDTESGNGLDIF